MKTLEQWIDLYSRFLVESIGIKENSTLAYLVPIRKLLKFYSSKVNKTLLDLSDLADFLSDFPSEELESYPETIELMKKYKTFDKAIEYFSSFVEYYFRLSLETQEFSGGRRYEIHTKGFGVISVDEIEILNNFISFTNNGKKQLINSNEVVLIKEN
jgi:hypothetical protein